MKTYFEGDLIRGDELNRVARQRQRKYHEITVPKPDKESYLEKGWKERREYARSVRLWREKPIDELLEDEVWLLFWNMGFIEMNRDRNFTIQVGPIEKQIQVFARDENYAFVVECKTSGVEGKRIATEDILEFSGLRGDIATSIIETYGRSTRVCFVMATRGIEWTSEKEQLAESKGIIVCKEDELEYYNELARHLGSVAKFQIYSILFPKEKIPEPIRVPAIRGGKGRAKYYCFVIQPEKLLQIAYVHHRRSTPEDLTGSYQRMLKKSRLGQIGHFITGGGYFPNNIILNFTERPIFSPFKKENQAGDVLFGMLELPRQYASAWIIDGQHRLYGYADNEKGATATVPVLAFHSLDVKEQAKLFVEINREQKAVSSNLLWDLYPDIYHDSDEPEHQSFRAISLVVKKLNIDSGSPLRDHINIPSTPSKGRKITNLTMATVCDALRESDLIKAGEGFLYNTDYDTTVEFAAERLKTYFDAIAKDFAEDWQKGNEGLLRTNIGIRIFIIVLRQLLKYFKHLGLERFYEGDPRRFKREAQKYLSPAIAKLRDMPDQQRSDIRKASAKGLVMDNARRMTWWINEEFEGFGLEILLGWAPPVPTGQTDEAIKRLLEDTERQLRVFVSERLKETYGEKWFRRIDKGIREYIDKGLKEEIAREPWKESMLQSLPLEKRMRFTTTGQLKVIIEGNWDAFEEVLVDRPYALAQLKSFVDLRSVYAHHREQECDIVVKNLGYWATRWIRKYIGLNKVEEEG
jgi:DNA sulfur modification protein DndB